ncbi:MAG: LacI family DNA-binding transcriptional regulator [Saprospiraceae bacterium]|nr:LacI family DNA-binding transcriptional regulator [Saprospiraceae bacterium]
MHTVTIKDIAKALNLSTSTVSRALRDSYEINPETKQLVLEYAEKMNYRPNPIALSLRENKSWAIGVIVPEIANHFFSQAINGIEETAYKRGYHVMIFQSNESYEREVANVGHIVARRVDGLLISISNQTSDVNHLKELHEQGLPIVLFDRVSDEIHTHKVVTDNFKGAFQATEHLILSGRRRIAHLTSSSFLYIAKERLAGYRAALEKHDIPFDERLIYFSKAFDSEYVRNSVEELLMLNPKPDAFFTASDRLALGCLEALHELNVKIPREIALIGFTNLRAAHLLSPALSTVCQPAFDMGKTAAGLLLDLIESKKKPIEFKTINLQTEIVIRKSS